MKLLAALALARIGDSSRAKTLTADLEKSYPADTVLKVYWLPTLKAAIELDAGTDRCTTTAILKPHCPYELGQPPPSCSSWNYVSGLPSGHSRIACPQRRSRGSSGVSEVS